MRKFKMPTAFNRGSAFEMTAEGVVNPITPTSEVAIGRLAIGRVSMENSLS